LLPDRPFSESRSSGKSPAKRANLPRRGSRWCSGQQRKTGRSPASPRSLSSRACD
jgi:hypothetical protein